MSMMVSFVLSFFPRDVLDEILNLIESVSEDFLTTLLCRYISSKFMDFLVDMLLACSLYFQVHMQ